MLLIGVDVPPLGPRPTHPWRGVARGELRPRHAWPVGDRSDGAADGNDPREPRRVATFRVVANGSTLKFSIPRGALGNPWLVPVHGGRGTLRQRTRDGGGADFAPARSTFRYAPTG